MQRQLLGSASSFLAFSFVLGVAALSGCAAGPGRGGDCRVTFESCKETGCEGWVEVKFDTSSQGAVIQSEVTRSCPPGYFDGQALKTVAGMTPPSSQWGREGLRMRFNYAPDARGPETPPESPSPSDLPLQDVFAAVAGTWGWLQGDDTCATNPHTLQFSQDRTTMSLTQLHPTPMADGTSGTAVRYRVIDHDERSIRMELEGETRRDPFGSLVVWDLKLLSHNAYCWHRADWPSDACTRQVVRCR